MREKKSEEYLHHIFTLRPYYHPPLTIDYEGCLVFTLKMCERKNVKNIYTTISHWSITNSDAKVSFLYTLGRLRKGWLIKVEVQVKVKLPSPKVWVDFGLKVVCRTEFKMHWEQALQNKLCFEKVREKEKNSLIYYWSFWINCLQNSFFIDTTISMIMQFHKKNYKKSELITTF